MTRARSLVALAAAIASASSLAAAHAGDFRIVPGTRIGSVRLGMTEGEVTRLLHKPMHSRRIDQLVPTGDAPGGASESRRIGKGVVLDTWLGPRLPNILSSSPIIRNYVSVFFIHGRAAQIEVSAAQFGTTSGLTTRSADWEKRLPPTSHFSYKWTASSDSDASSPAAKHVLEYADNIRQGIACKYGAWGDLSPEATSTGIAPDAVIVHLPGQTVLLNPNDADDYSGTGHRSDLPNAGK